MASELEFTPAQRETHTALLVRLRLARGEAFVEAWREPREIWGDARHYLAALDEYVQKAEQDPLEE